MVTFLDSTDMICINSRKRVVFYDRHLGIINRLYQPEFAQRNRSKRAHGSHYRLLVGNDTETVLRLRFLKLHELAAPLLIRNICTRANPADSNSRGFW